MSSSYAYSLLAAELIRERHEEARLLRLAEAAAERRSAPATVDPRSGRETFGGSAAREHARCWTLRLAGLAVTVSLDTAVQPGARS